MKPNFSQMKLDRDFFKNDSMEAWKKNIERETGKPLEELLYHTMEQIDVKPLYTAEDYKSATHLPYMAGIPRICAGPIPLCM